MRAVSTVLDVSLCLLFVTASALTLVGTPVADRSNPDSAPDIADEVAEVLTTATASVSYGVGDRNRTAHDTLAGLLASAALADANSASALEFRSVTTQRVTRALGAFDVAVQVVADPTPVGDSISSADSARDGIFVVGTPPPPNADVHAARVPVRGVKFTVRTWSR